MEISVTEILTEFVLDDDIWRCPHTRIKLDEPCCVERGESGYIECACNGQVGIECDNPDCTGISDSEIDSLLNNFINDEAMDCEG